MMIWGQFIFLALVISFFGFKLSKLADQISTLTGLGRNIVGLILLASVTSLPELATGISAVTVADNPNLAIGDIMGSCCFNLATVVILDALYTKGSVYSRSTRSHLLMCVLGIMLIAFTGFMLALKNTSFVYINHLSVYTFIIPFLYFFSVYEIYRSEKEEEDSTEKGEGKLAPVIFKFVFCSIIIVTCGIYLSKTADQIFLHMKWNAAFVGTLFVAMATSLPEISVTISALRMNATELAFSNLLGSNIFNFLILAIDDLAFKKGPLLKYADSSHVVTAFSCLMMTSLVAFALMKPPQKKIFNMISGLSALIIFIYVLNLIVSYNSLD